MNIPTSWKDIRLTQFEAATHVEKIDYDDPIDQMIDWISAITGATEDELRSMPIDQLTGIAKKLSWIKNPEFTGKLPTIFMIGNKIYRVNYEIDKLTTAQYVELCTWMKKDPLLNLDKVMASLTIELKWYQWKGKYDGDSHKVRAELFRKHLSLAVIYPIALFFFRVYTRSIEDIKVSSLNLIRKQNRELVKTLLQSVKEQQETHS